MIAIHKANFTQPSATGITLEAILAAKEYRAAARSELISRRTVPVISLTVNMPGPCKTGPDITSLLHAALGQLRPRLASAGFHLLEENIQHRDTGPFALLAVAGDAAAIKSISIALEDALPYGRLLDIDVFDAAGCQLSRATSGFPPRSCFICRLPAAECVRNQTHSPAEVLVAAQKHLLAFHAANTAACSQPVSVIAAAALEAMLMELACTPAPGLVDRFNNGAHQDMDFFTFIKSSSVLSSAMYRFALAGWNHCAPPDGLLPVLRLVGQEAETAMFKATGGVNTQKGLLFLLGILTASAALTLHSQPPTALSAGTLTTAAAICEGLVDRELTPLRTSLPDRKLTAGERFFLSHNSTGIRGELAAGLPLVKNYGLPALRNALAAKAPLNDALVHALLALMAVAEDSTVFNRHGLAGLKEVQHQAAVIWQAGGMLTNNGKALTARLDHAFIAAGISPGGSADLLACTYFLYVLDNESQNLYKVINNNNPNML